MMNISSFSKLPALNLEVTTIDSEVGWLQLARPMGEKTRKKKAAAAAIANGEAAPAGDANSAAAAKLKGASDLPARMAPAHQSKKKKRRSSAALPLANLEVDWLGGFFELCFGDERLVELCRELKLNIPGFRLETLPPEEVAQVLADEYLAAKDETIRGEIELAVREALRTPMFEGRKIAREAAWRDAGGSARRDGHRRSSAASGAGGVGRAAGRWRR